MYKLSLALLAFFTFTPSGWGGKHQQCPANARWRDVASGADRHGGVECLDHSCACLGEHVVDFLCEVVLAAPCREAHG